VAQAQQPDGLVDCVGLLAVIYYSATGTVHALAQAVAKGAASAGAEVRLRRVAEASASIAEASIEDLAWADAFAFGTPSRFGAPAAQLRQFIDQAGGLWREGKLADKPVTAFTSAFNRHGGNEATILSPGNVFYHWGAVIVPPGYTDPAVYAAAGNPYGTSFATGPAGDSPDAAALDAARYQGRRLAQIALQLRRPAGHAGQGTALTGDYEPSALGWVREHVEQIERTGTTDGVTMDHRPTVLMTYRGAKTGKIRKTPVMRVEHEGRYAAVASKGGEPTSPQWYASLLTEPVIDLQDGTVTRVYRAREVSGDEKVLWWRRAVDAFPDYAGYQRKTDRQIPVFVLEPEGTRQ
jgi:NAD(P)H dehydrogenase (quinone)